MSKKPSKAAMRAHCRMIEPPVCFSSNPEDHARVIDEEFAAVYKFIRNEASGPVVFSLDPSKKSFVVARELLEDLGIPLEEDSE